MSIVPADYCVSLEMAQRPELHAAMEAAGYFGGLPIKLVNFWWGDVPKLGSGNWQLFMHRQTLSELNGHGGFIAYHLGELWAAAVKFMPEGSGLSLAHRGQPRSLAEPVMASCGNAGGEYATSVHAPDALAELVIALHKEASDVR